MSLHDIQELDDDLGARPDHDLSLARLLGIVDALERVAQHTGANHCDGRFVGKGASFKQSLVWERFSSPFSFWEKTTGNWRYLFDLQQHIH
jgi:hypothetical protein